MLVKNSWTFILNVWYSKQNQQLCGQQQVNSKTDSQVYTVYWIDEGLAPAAFNWQPCWFSTTLQNSSWDAQCLDCTANPVMCFLLVLCWAITSERTLASPTHATCHFWHWTNQRGRATPARTHLKRSSLMGRWRFSRVHPTMSTVLHTRCLQSRLSAVVDQEMPPVHDHFYFYMCQPGEINQ